MPGLSKEYNQNKLKQIKKEKNEQKCSTHHNT